jgi:hypothetical protein
MLAGFRFPWQQETRLSACPMEVNPTLAEHIVKPGVDFHAALFDHFHEALACSLRFAKKHNCLAFLKAQR